MGEEAADEATASEDQESTDEAPETDQESTDEAPETDQEGGLDLEAQQARLDEVENKIEEGRRALAEQETKPEPEAKPEPETDGQPVAEDEGAADAPPG